MKLKQFNTRNILKNPIYLLMKNWNKLVLTFNVVYNIMNKGCHRHNGKKWIAVKGISKMPYKNTFHF